MKGQHRVLLAGMLSVALAFGITIPLGFWLARRISGIPDLVLGVVLVIVLVGIAAGVMRLLVGPLWPARKVEIGPLRRPDPDTEPNRTGYEISFEDFRRLVTDPTSQGIVAPLLRDWYRYEIAGQGDKTALRSEEGHVVGLRVLHNRIQMDPPKQRSIYGVAMDLWR